MTPAARTRAAIDLLDAVAAAAQPAAAVVADWFRRRRYGRLTADVATRLRVGCS